MKKIKAIIMAFYPLWIFYISQFVFWLFGMNEYVVDIRFFPIALIWSMPITASTLYLVVNYSINVDKAVQIKNRSIFVDDRPQSIDKVILYRRFFQNETHFSLFPWDRWYYFEITVGKKTYYKTYFDIDIEDLKPNETILVKFPRMGKKHKRMPWQSDDAHI